MEKFTRPAEFGSEAWVTGATENSLKENLTDSEPWEKFTTNQETMRLSFSMKASRLQELPSMK